MRINNIDNRITYKGALDSALTQAMRCCDMNEMVNAVGLDVGAMVVPRAYYDTKHRNEFAGFETFFREISGTFINCLAAGIIAIGISNVASKYFMNSVKINPDSWYTDSSLAVLDRAWQKSGNTKDYVITVLDNLEGLDGYKNNKFKNIDWNSVEWADEAKWTKYNWKNSEYKNIQNRIKSKEDIINVLTKVINDKTINSKDKSQILDILNLRITNALGAERNAKLNIDDKTLNSRVEYILRDMVDAGRDIFKNGKNAQKIIEKIIKINKFKSAGAISGACLLGLTNQFINRKITEKRTGKKGFVGNPNYVADGNSQNKKDKYLWVKKILASTVMLGLVFSTMKVKNFKQFAKKLEFSGPVTSGNAIKTVYGANITGRFLAADDGDELRESMTRDYLGFLNWLVFGGFAAKGVGNLLDRKGQNLFNYTKKGKGLKHWLNEMSLKTHNEIAAKGSEFAKKNMWKLNVAHIAGIAYSAISLGLLLPMLNAYVTNKKYKKEV